MCYYLLLSSLKMETFKICLFKISVCKDMQIEKSSNDDSKNFQCHLDYHFHGFSFIQMKEKTVNVHC